MKEVPMVGSFVIEFKLTTAFRNGGTMVLFITVTMRKVVLRAALLVRILLRVTLQTAGNTRSTKLSTVIR